MIFRNGRTENWRLLLLSTQIVRGQVNIQAPQVYRIVGVASNKKYVVPLKQLQPPNILERAAISVME